MSKHRNSENGPIRFLFVALSLWLVAMPITWFSILDRYAFFKGFAVNLGSVCTPACTELDVFSFVLFVGLVGIALIFIAWLLS